jgi:hypothetical protein
MPEQSQDLKDQLKNVLQKTFNLLEGVSPIVASQYQGICDFHLNTGEVEDLCLAIPSIYGAVIATGSLIQEDTLEKGDKADTTPQKSFLITKELRKILRETFETIEKNNPLFGAFYQSTYTSIQASLDIEELCKAIDFVNVNKENA